LNSIIPGEQLIFNEKYLLKSDKKRFILIKRASHDVFLDPNESHPPEDVNAIIHPLIALLFVLFDGRRTAKDIISEYSNILGVNEGHVSNFVKEILKGPVGQNKGKYLKFADDYFYIPRNIIVANDKGIKLEKNIDIKDFLIPKNELDLHSLRNYSPIDCILEINFKCLTDCIYCYADRRKHIQCSIPIERLKEIIREARHIGMRTFDISGGELFLYDKWDILIKELQENDFKPYISTKIPISKQVIKKLKSLGVREIQLSIDSINENQLNKILKVDTGYWEKITQTLKCLEKEGFKLFINSQITNFNDHPEDVKEMIDFFLNFNNIRSIKVGSIGYSLYKPQGNYIDTASNLDTVKKIEEIVNRYKENIKDVSINFSGYATKEKFVDDLNEKEKKYWDRVRCSGNFYAFVILPDGKVTVCEELYFHPKFIIGDLKEQSIEEVWNSESALELYKMPKEKIREESACKSCEKFEKCHQIRGVCWKEILCAYGYENWDYPDPKCPYAPAPYNRFWLE
jgi:radical SAM protein with 4Fe4S-binding SPASM domain